MRHAIEPPAVRETTDLTLSVDQFFGEQFSPWRENGFGRVKADADADRQSWIPLIWMNCLA